MARRRRLCQEVARQGDTVADLKAMGEGARAGVEAWLVVSGGNARACALPDVLALWVDAFTPPDAQNAPATPSEVAPPCEDPPTPAKPTTGPQGAREVATPSTAIDSDPWDALPPMMPIAA